MIGVVNVVIVVVDDIVAVCESIITRNRETSSNSAILFNLERQALRSICACAMSFLDFSKATFGRTSRMITTGCYSQSPADNVTERSGESIMNLFTNKLLRRKKFEMWHAT